MAENPDQTDAQACGTAGDGARPDGAESLAAAPIHGRIPRHLNQLRIPAEPRRLGAASLTLEILGPCAPAAGELLGEPRQLLGLLDHLHRHIWKEGIPAGGRPGVYSEPLTQRILDAYALELSAAGIGHALHLPLSFTADQPAPEIPGLLVAMRLVVQPAGGRGSVQVAFLVDPADDGRREAPAAAGGVASVGADAAPR